MPDCAECHVDVALIALTPALRRIPQRARSLGPGLIRGQADVTQHVRLQSGQMLAGLAQMQGAQDGAGNAPEKGGFGWTAQRGGTGHGMSFLEDGLAGLAEGWAFLPIARLS